MSHLRYVFLIFFFFTKAQSLSSFILWPHNITSCDFLHISYFEFYDVMMLPWWLIWQSVTVFWRSVYMERMRSYECELVLVHTNGLFPLPYSYADSYSDIMQKGSTGTNSNNHSDAKLLWKLLKNPSDRYWYQCQIGYSTHLHRNRNQNRFSGKSSAHYYISHLNQNLNRNRTGIWVRHWKHTITITETKSDSTELSRMVKCHWNLL